MLIQNITFNLAMPKIRHDVLEGKSCIVAPMVMLTEGVHEGSNGPIYYPPEELAKTPAVWNHKPIVVYHPQINGQGVSACEPIILNSRKVGIILNTDWQAPKLRAEAWLDPEKVKIVDSRVMDAIDNRQAMELSTGLFIDNEAKEGNWNGEAYKTIARNIRPDHLAILPDQKGACSLADGAGLLRNQSQSDISLAQLVLSKAQALLQNELSFGDMGMALASMLPKSKEGGPFPFIVDIFKDYFVYELGGRLFKQEYEVEKDKPRVKGLPAEVRKVVSYTANSRKENEMDKKTIVDAIIANKGNTWEEGDREFLMELDEAKLGKLNAPAPTVPVDNAKLDATKSEVKSEGPKADPPPVANVKQEAPKPVTADEYINNAPDGIREMLQSGLKAHGIEKSKRIAVITANKANRYSQEQLQAKTLEELDMLAALAAPAPTANYAGQGTPAAPVVNDGKDEEPLQMPVINFEKNQ